MNALRQIRERMGVTPRQLAEQMQISERTVHDQERARAPRKVYVLAALRLEDVQTARNAVTLDAARNIMKRIADLAEQGVKL